MMIKKFAAVMAAAVMAMASAPCAFADWGYDNGYNTYDNNTYDNGNTGYDNNGWTADNGADNGAVTTAPAGDGPAETSVETAGNVVTSMGATTTSDKPTSAPSRVYLQTSEIKDGIVTAELRIEADAVVSEALVSVTFDTNSLQLVGTAINEEAGGKAEETTFKFSHYRPSPAELEAGVCDLNDTTVKFSTAIDRSIAPYYYCAENIAAGKPTAEETFSQWKNSSRHWKAITAPNITHMGVGVAYAPSSPLKYYWETLFIQTDKTFDPSLAR